jgi:hypothetical protein
MQTTLNSSLPNRALTVLCAVAITLGFTSGSVLAHEDHPDKDLPAHEQSHKAEPPTGGHANLAGAATNPVANLVQFQIQDTYSPHSYNASGYSNVGIIQPVVPFKLPWEKVPLLVTRTTLPYISTPDLGSGVGRKDGVGDLVAQGYFIPKLETKGVTVGLGYNLSIPTAGDNDYVGSGKWSFGPGAIYLNQQTPTWQWGVLTYSSFSFASANADRDHVANIAVQPILVKHFSEGWYAAVPDVPQTYNFKTNHWTLQLGPRLGRVMKFGKQPVNLFGQITYNPLDYDDEITADWSFKINLTMLFPK